MTRGEFTVITTRPGRRSGRALSSGLAIIMLVGTLGYVVRDNFRVGAVRAGPDALGDARRAVELAPGSLSAQLSLVAALVASDDLEGALAALAVAEGLDPDHPDVESARRLLEQAPR